MRPGGRSSTAGSPGRVLVVDDTAQRHRTSQITGLAVNGSCEASGPGTWT
jgi:hypothetical protein